MTSVSAGHIILTPTQPVGSRRPQRESNPGPPHQESCPLPTELPPRNNGANITTIHHHNSNCRRHYHCYHCQPYYLKDHHHNFLNRYYNHFNITDTTISMTIAIYRQHDHQVYLALSIPFFPFCRRFPCVGQKSCPVFECYILL